PDTAFQVRRLRYYVPDTASQVLRPRYCVPGTTSQVRRMQDLLFWNASPGTPHLGRFIRDASSGTVALGRFAWDASSGTVHLALLHAVLLKLGLIEADAQPRAGRQGQAARGNVEARGGDGVFHLERPHALESGQHVAGRGGEHDLGERAGIESEAVAAHDRQSRGFRGGEPARPAHEAARLLDAELDEVRRIGLDDRDETGVVADRLVRHHGYAAFPADPRHSRKIVLRHRLLEELHVVLLDHARELQRRV